MTLLELINELLKMRVRCNDNIEVEACVFKTKKDCRFDRIESIDETENENGNRIVSISLKNAYHDYEQMTYFDWLTWPLVIPRRNGTYLITVEDWQGISCVMIAQYSKMGGWNISPKLRVAAWTEIPEPYKYKEENECDEN